MTPPAADRLRGATRAIRREIPTLWAFGVREYRIWQSYRVNQILWMVNIFVTTLLLYVDFVPRACGR
jgi:hypothetical protein